MAKDRNKKLNPRIANEIEKLDNFSDTMKGQYEELNRLIIQYNKAVDKNNKNFTDKLVVFFDGKKTTLKGYELEQYFDGILDQIIKKENKIIEEINRQYSQEDIDKKRQEEDEATFKAEFEKKEKETKGRLTEINEELDKDKDLDEEAKDVEKKKAEIEANKEILEKLEELKKVNEEIKEIDGWITNDFEKRLNEYEAAEKEYNAQIKTVEQAERVLDETLKELEELEKTISNLLKDYENEPDDNEKQKIQEKINEANIKKKSLVKMYGNKPKKLFV
jgi:DNA repair exonuclease SbcCD ATPase subunit